MASGRGPPTCSLSREGAIETLPALSSVLGLSPAKSTWKQAGEGAQGMRSLEVTLPEQDGEEQEIIWRSIRIWLKKENHWEIYDTKDVLHRLDLM